MKKKIVIPVSIVSIAAIAVAIVALTGSASKTTTLDSTSLTKSDLQSTLAITGTVKSNTSKKVYGNLQYNVDTVNVKVGDVVKKGDVLCTLETDDIQDQIVMQKAQMNISDFNSNYQLTDAERQYQDALNDYNNDTNLSILNAENALKSAELSVKTAKTDYDNAVAINNTDKDTNIKDLELSIEQLEKNLKDAKIQLTLSKEKDKLDSTNPSQDYELNYQKARQKFNDIMSSGSQTLEMTNARNAYENAVNKYEYALKTGSTYDITSAEEAVTQASANLDSVMKSQEYSTIKDEYDQATMDYLTRKYTDNTADCQRAVDLAQKNLDNAKENLTQVKNNKTLDTDYKKDTYVTAQRQLELAKQSYEDAVSSVETSLTSLKNAADLSRITSANDTSTIQLQNLLDTLDDCTVKSPINGTVTAVYATEGSSGAGLLFVIEDTNDLMITSKVKEYDISYVSDGQPVIIKSDAINSDEEYNGLVNEVSPTTIKAPDGSDAGTGEFNVDVSVSDQDTKLMIGMTAKMTVITNEKKGVYTIKYESLLEDKDGKNYVYVAEPSGTGYIAKKVYVKTGIESDFEVEIISDEITEGTIIINDTDYIVEGSPVNVNIEDKDKDNDEEVSE